MMTLPKIINVVTGEENEMTREMLAILEHVGEYTCDNYDEIEKESGIRKKDLQVAMVILKQAGLLAYTSFQDCDGVPHGSGHTLTSKGLELQEFLANSGVIIIKVRDYYC